MNLKIYFLLTFSIGCRLQSLEFSLWSSQENTCTIMPITTASSLSLPPLSSTYITSCFQFQIAVLSSSSGQKALLPGRIITLKTINGYKLLSVILNIESGSSGQNMNDRKVTVLSITDAQNKGKQLG